MQYSMNVSSILDQTLIFLNSKCAIKASPHLSKMLRLTRTYIYINKLVSYVKLKDL